MHNTYTQWKGEHKMRQLVQNTIPLKTALVFYYSVVYVEKT